MMKGIGIILLLLHDICKSGYLWEPSSVMSDSTFPFVYHGQVIAAGAVLPAVGIICVTLRFIARTEGKNAIGVDDWTALAAVVRTSNPSL